MRFFGQRIECSSSSARSKSVGRTVNERPTFGNRQLIIVPASNHRIDRYREYFVNIFLRNSDRDYLSAAVFVLRMPCKASFSTMNIKVPELYR
jgi:hypothetical protein